LTVSPVERRARELNLAPLLAPSDLKDPFLPPALAALGAEIFVVVAFRLLPESIFSIPPLGTLNIHASLLPRFRGPAPIQRAIEAGAGETGVTIFRIDKGIDTGGILARRATPIGDEETAPQLYERLSRLGADALVGVVAGAAHGTIKAEAQDHSLATPAPKLRKEEGRIDWSSPARCIYNRIRAFKPFPGTYTCLGGKSLSVEWARPTPTRSGHAPGTLVAADSFDVQCGDTVLRLERVKPEGGRSMEAAAFLRGRRIAQGTVLG
jgi:methionyl-tRNA formyltransferase